MYTPSSTTKSVCVCARARGGEPPPAQADSSQADPPRPWLGEGSRGSGLTPFSKPQRGIRPSQNSSLTHHSNPKHDGLRRSCADCPPTASSNKRSGRKQKQRELYPCLARGILERRLDPPSVGRGTPPPPLPFVQATPMSKQHWALVPSSFAPLILAVRCSMRFNTVCPVCFLMPWFGDPRCSYFVSRQLCWPKGHL